MTVSTFNIAVNSDDGFTQGQNVTYGSVICSFAGSTDANLEAGRELTGGNHRISVSHLRWDTSSIPDGDAVASATLRLFILGKFDVDARNVVADWHDFGAAVDCTDWLHDSLNSAISGVTIASLTVGANNTLTLTGVSNVSKTGLTGIRLHVSGGEPTGRNQYEFAALDHLTSPEAQLSVTHAVSVSCSLSGTVTDDNEANIITGGSTIILTLTNAIWVAVGATFNAQRQNIINGIDSAQAEVNGWDAKVRPAILVGDVVRTSDTVVTITLPAVSDYAISANEIITATVPDTAFV